MEIESAVERNLISLREKFGGFDDDKGLLDEEMKVEDDSSEDYEVARARDSDLMT